MTGALIICVRALPRLFWLLRESRPPVANTDPAPGPSLICSTVELERWCPWRFLR